MFGDNTAFAYVVAVIVIVLVKADIDVSKKERKKRLSEIVESGKYGWNGIR